MKKRRTKAQNVLVVFTTSLVLRQDNVRQELNGNLPRKFFMGFGYNPDLVETGERLDILDYFSWVKELSRYQEVEWILWDASCYYIVNRTKQKRINETALERKEAREIVEILFDELQKPKKRKIRENNELRTKYLNAILKATGINGRVIDAYSVIWNDANYLKAFEFCLGFCKAQQNLQPRRVPVPRSANRVQALYFPLETAEALFLQQRFGIDAKFGPATEERFDFFITEAANQLGRGYASLWCPVPPETVGTPYLRPRNGGSIFFTNSMDDVRRKLSENETYKKWLEAVIEPLAPGLCLEQGIEKIISDVRGELK